MRVHFSSALPCALRLGGAPAGMCGEAEKFADLPDGEEILVEFLPADGNYFPLSFIWNGEFLAHPPAGVECCLYDCGADVRAFRFTPRSLSLRVLAQTRAAGMLLTAFDCGGPRLCAEGSRFFFLRSAAGRHRAGGRTHRRRTVRTGPVPRREDGSAAAPLAGRRARL